MWRWRFYFGLSSGWASVLLVYVLVHSNGYGHESQNLQYIFVQTDDIWLAKDQVKVFQSLCCG